MNKNLKKTLTGLFLFLALSTVLSAQKAAKEQTDEDATKKNYMGWIDSSTKDVSVRFGDVRMSAKTKIGSFNISVINEAGKKIPVLYSGNEYTSTGFYLKVNNKVYKLISESNIKTAARKTNNGMQINYSIKNVAEVFVDFKCVKSTSDSGFDMVKITSTVTNTSGKKADFALKLILDTILGESGNAHFYTSSDIPIKSEVLYRTMQNEKWFTSKNDYAEMQILLDGGDITSPEIVALANYSTLEKNNWEPEILSNRTFDTVLSYNNSAAGILWPSKKVSADGRLTNCFYLAFGTDGQKAKGDVYLSEMKKSSTDILETVENMIKTEIVDVDNDVTLVEVELPLEKPVEPSASVETKSAPIVPIVPVVEPVVVPVVTPVVTPVKTPAKINKLSSEQLTPEYIQNLIDRISAMENEPDLVSEEEIKLLNAELDAILQALM